MQGETMNMLILTLAVTVLTVFVALMYLRPVTHRVLLDLCDRAESGAVFWLRTANTLAISGALVLTLTFADANRDLLATMRFSILIAAIAVFATAFLIAGSIWRRVLTVDEREHAIKIASVEGV
jgi:hypothetical protein